MYIDRMCTYVFRHNKNMCVCYAIISYYVYHVILHIYNFFEWTSLYSHGFLLQLRILTSWLSSVCPSRSTLHLSLMTSMGLVYRIPVPVASDGVWIMESTRKI